MRCRVWLILLLLLAPTAIGAAAGQPDTERLIVTLEVWPPDARHADSLATLGAEVTDELSVSRALLVEAPAGTAEQIRAFAFVAAVERDDPVDPMLASSKQAAGLTGAVRQAGVTGEGTTIALVDSGIDTDHPGLRDRVKADLVVSDDGVREGPSSNSKHGTHIAGVLVGTGAGAGADRGDSSGVAPGAELVSIDLSEQFTTSSALRAFEWIYENHETYDIQVVSNSWGRQRDPATYDPDDAIIRASDALVSQGLTVVFSAGNGGEGQGQMTLEATNPNVITVGAATDGGRVESYSSRGPVYDGDQEADWTKPDLVAPGSRIVSTRADGGARAYTMMNGTSMAAPHVAGAAALLLSVNPDLTPEQVKGILVESAHDLGPAGVDDASGHGLVDIDAALRILEQAGDHVEERSSTTERRGQLTGPTEAGAILSAASVDSADTFTIAVPTNATELAAKLSWDGQRPLEVRLTDPAGSPRSYEIKGQETLEIDQPLEGTWEVRLKPTGVNHGEYHAELTVTWLEHRDGLELPMVKQRVQQSSFPSIEGPGLFGPSLIPGVPNIVPIALGSVMTLVMVAGKLSGGSSKREEDPQTAEFSWDRMD